MSRILAVLLAGLWLMGCGGGAKPTQEQLGKQLTELAAALESGDLDKALNTMMLPPGRSVDELKPMLPKLVERKEISSDGVKLLLAKGTFGKLVDIFPEHGGKRAERAGLKAEECYGMRLDPGEVMAHWDGSSFKIFRLDDVGKISADGGSAPKIEGAPGDEPKTEAAPAPTEPTPAPAEPTVAPAPTEPTAALAPAEPTPAPTDAPAPTPAPTEGE